MNRVRRIAARVRSRLSDRALILMYHRVAEIESDPWELCVTPQNFAEHLQVLKAFGATLQAGRLAAAIEAGRLPHRAVAVTFDDGYADNLTMAKPALEQFEIPATVFVASGCIGSDSEFWWDELESLLLQPGSLPNALRLNVNGEQHCWGLREASHYSSASFADNRDWRPWKRPDPGPRQSLYRALWELMHLLEEGERQRLRDELLLWAGRTRAARPTHRCMSADELLSLGRCGLVEIGCHTATHPKLASLPSDTQRAEINDSRAKLEEILGRPIAGFAYPYGRKCDYTAETVGIVRQAGFTYACTTVPGTVNPKANLLELPRFQVPNVNGDAFAGLLRKWFGHDA